MASFGDILTALYFIKLGGFSFLVGVDFICYLGATRCHFLVLGLNALDHGLSLIHGKGVGARRSQQARETKGRSPWTSILGLKNPGPELSHSFIIAILAGPDLGKKI